MVSFFYSFSQTAREIIQKADEKLRGTTSLVELTIKTIRPTWTRSMDVKAWMKGSDYSMIFIQSPAKELGTKDKEGIVATAAYGKGKVLAVGDPWLYNEYVDGRKLPAEYENYKAAEDLVKWLLSKSK